jgi:hypothetical protein
VGRDARGPQRAEDAELAGDAPHPNWDANQRSSSDCSIPARCSEVLLSGA